MKKIFAILFVAGMTALASCTSKEASNVDSTMAATTDSVVTAVGDSVTATVDSLTAPADTTKK